MPEHMVQYLKATLKTEIPEHINEKKILNFDQNFESGNIDSVYLVDQEEYNLLMKVDTNTRGKTVFFYFKVTNFRIGKTYTFNILNFTKNLDKFVHNGMNILTKA